MMKWWRDKGAEEDASGLIGAAVTTSRGYSPFL